MPKMMMAMVKGQGTVCGTQSILGHNLPNPVAEGFNPQTLTPANLKLHVPMFACKHIEIHRHTLPDID